MMNCPKYACDCELRTGLDVLIVPIINNVGTIIGFSHTEMDHIKVRLPNGMIHAGPKESFIRV